MANIIHPTAIIGDNVTLGDGNTIGPYTVIGYPGAIRNAQDFTGTIEIGDGNTIGSHVTIAAGSDGVTRIGSGNILMNHSNYGHNCTVGDECEIGAGTIVCGWATIGNGAKVKAHCTVRNRKAIGAGAVVGMGTNVVGDVPEGVTCYGNPQRLIPCERSTSTASEGSQPIAG